MAMTPTGSILKFCLKYGSDGYRDVLARLAEKGIEPPEDPGKDGGR